MQKQVDAEPIKDSKQVSGQAPGLAQSQEEVVSLIERDFEHFSKRLQQVARYILDSQSEIAFSTVAEIAKHAGVHPSSLIRLANALGFNGFSDMQKLFKAKLVEEQNNYQQRIESVQSDASLDQLDASKALLGQVCEANHLAIAALPQSIDSDDLERARNLLQHAKVIHVQGVRRSFPVATYLSYLLSNMQLPVHLIDGMGGMGLQQQSLLGEGDTVVAISFYPYANETAELLQQAKSKGCSVIAFTDSTVSPLAKVADVCFCVKEAEVHAFRSLNATLCLVQALAMSLVKN